MATVGRLCRTAAARTNCVVQTPDHLPDEVTAACANADRPTVVFGAHSVYSVSPSLRRRACSLTITPAVLHTLNGSLSCPTPNKPTNLLLAARHPGKSNLHLCLTECRISHRNCSCHHRSSLTPASLNPRGIILGLGTRPLPPSLPADHTQRRWSILSYPIPSASPIQCRIAAFSFSS